MRIEKEFNEELAANKEPIEVLQDIRKIPADKLFSKFAVFEIINKTSKTKTM